MKRGVTVSVLREAGSEDCEFYNPEQLTNKYDRFILIGEGITGPEEVTGDEPNLLILERTDPLRNGGEYLIARPPGKKLSVGGNFVYGWNSRFRSVAHYPIPVFDRVEVNLDDLPDVVPLYVLEKMQQKSDRARRPDRRKWANPCTDESIPLKQRMELYREWLEKKMAAGEVMLHELNEWASKR